VGIGASVSLLLPNRRQPTHEENREIGTGELDNLTSTLTRRGNSYPAEVTNPICAIPDPIPTTIGWHSMCLSVRNSNLFSSRVTTVAIFDSEDSDGPAALLGKRYGL
jgi:hypothetical protein